MLERVFELRKELQVFLTSKTSAHEEFFSNLPFYIREEGLCIVKSAYGYHNEELWEATQCDFSVCYPRMQEF